MTEKQRSDHAAARPGDHWASLINQYVKASKAEIVLLCEASVAPLAGNLSEAMTRLLTAGEYDAVVCDFRVAFDDRAQAALHRDALSGRFCAIPGTPDTAPVWNTFGAGVFLISRQRFLQLGGFDENLAASRFAHWELLNRLLAANGRIAAVPQPLVAWLFPSADELAATDLHLCELLTAPWIEGLDAQRAQLVRRAISTGFMTDPQFQAIREFLTDRMPAADQEADTAKFSLFGRFWRSPNSSRR